MNNSEFKLDIAFIQANVEGRELIEERAKVVFDSWHRKVCERNFEPDIDEIRVNYNSVSFETREYIGCGDYEYHTFDVPLECIAAEDYEAKIDEIVAERQAKREALTRAKAADDARKAQEKAELQVQEDLAQLARLESLYRTGKQGEV